MVRCLVLVLALLAPACVIRTTRARDATLHYHPTLDELRAAPRAEAVAPATPPAVEARVVVEDLASGYPQPIGLAYDGAGAFRKVVGVEWSEGELERALRDGLRVAFPGDVGAVARLGGGLVSLALYRFGGSVYASALLELRLVRDGTEIYAARYSASARGGDRAVLLAAVATGLTNQIKGDPALRAAIERGAP